MTSEPFVPYTLAMIGSFPCQVEPAAHPRPDVSVLSFVDLARGMVRCQLAIACQSNWRLRQRRTEAECERPSLLTQEGRSVSRRHHTTKKSRYESDSPGLSVANWMASAPPALSLP